MRFIPLIIGTAGKGTGEEGTRIVISRNSFGYETRETQQKVILKGLKRIFLVCSTLAQVFAFILTKNFDFDKISADEVIFEGGAEGAAEGECRRGGHRGQSTFGKITFLEGTPSPH